MRPFFQFKTYILCFILACVTPNLFAQSGELVVVIMIKNESANILETLQPYADGGVTRLVVLDTGSTDNTIEKVQTFFKKNPKIKGYLFEQPFINFATSRNYAIQCAEKTFTDDCFLFMPDAEWYMQNVQGLKKFCYEHAQDQSNSYLVKIRNEQINLTFYVQRLFKAHKGIRFEGVVHETIIDPTRNKVPDNIYILWNPSDNGQEKTKQRQLRDINLLLEQVTLNPQDTRSTFYLAQTYHALQDLENSKKYYQKRCEISTDPNEETYLAHYRLGVIYNELGQWNEALSYFLHAYNMRPHRAEPLVQIAQYYLQNNQYALAYLFAYNATKIPYPHNDVLAIQKEYYDFARYDILGCAAWYMKQYQIGREAVFLALKAHPKDERLLKNLNMYNTIIAQTHNRAVNPY